MRTAIAIMALVAAIVIPGAGRLADAQDSSLYHQQDAPLRRTQGSWIAVPLPEPVEVRKHDSVVVRVDELARMQSEGDVQRRKDGLYDALLKDWVHLVGLKALKPDEQADGDQRVRGQLQALYRADSELETRESLALNIACEIRDIRPNGTLVLEGHKSIRINHEVWEVSLSGICRLQDIGPDNVVLSRNLMNLQIYKRERGIVQDGYRRGWVTRLIDRFQPF